MTETQELAISSGIAIPNGLEEYREEEPEWEEPLELSDGRPEEPVEDASWRDLGAAPRQFDTRSLVEGGWGPTDKPDDIFRVPATHEFDLKRQGYHDDLIHSATLERIGKALIAASPALQQLGGQRIHFAWKKEGGSEDSRARLENCARLTGTARYGLRADFLITLSADHLRAAHATNFHVEASLFHALNHASLTDSGTPATASHDFSAFNDEVGRYGAWRSDLQGGRKALASAPVYGGTGWYALDILGAIGAEDDESAPESD